MDQIKPFYFDMTDAEIAEYKREMEDIPPEEGEWE